MSSQAVEREERRGEQSARIEGEAIHLYLETSTHSAIHSLSIPSQHQLRNVGAQNCCKLHKNLPVQFGIRRTTTVDWKKKKKERGIALQSK